MNAVRPMSGKRVIYVSDCMHCPFSVLCALSGIYRCGNVSDMRVIHEESEGVPDWCKLERADE